MNKKDMKTKRLFSILVAGMLLGCSVNVCAQTKGPKGTAPIKELSAKVGKAYDFSPEAVKKFQEEGDEMFESVYDILGGGCSFYCGCAIGELKASSTLKPQGKFSYSVKNVHDLSYATAWVEGVDGYGEGEWVQYTLPADNPTITTIKIANGYIRTKKAWQENSRVEALELSVNGKPYAMLYLKDVYAEQTFDIGELAPKNGKPLVLRFTIRSTYPGTKYKDTAISEIYFDGTGVH